jgi:hypothetical protein
MPIGYQTSEASGMGRKYSYLADDKREVRRRCLLEWQVSSVVAIQKLS